MIGTQLDCIMDVKVFRDSKGNISIVYDSHIDHQNNSINFLTSAIEKSEHNYYLNSNSLTIE